MRKHAIKSTLKFLPADGEASWLLLPKSVSLLSRSTVQPENNFFLYPQGDRSNLKMPKNDKHVHLPKLVSTSLRIIQIQF